MTSRGLVLSNDALSVTYSVYLEGYVKMFLNVKNQKILNDWP